jgi:hypothetical protein
MPSPADVLAVKRALLTRIPYELVDAVLALARYWASDSTHRDVALAVRASNEPLFNAKWIYMLSEPVPATRLQAVHFSIRSCDQGWGGFSEYKSAPATLARMPDSPAPDRYRNSYTWFEASILRPAAASQQQPPWLFDALHQPISLYATSLAPAPSPRGPIAELHSPYKNRNKRWLVQMNVQASRHIRRHDITWHANSPPHTAEYDDKTGSGRGLGFVDSLRAGDRIALVARALASLSLSLYSHITHSALVSRLGEQYQECGD